jgi:hypothetical protein
MNYHHIYGLNKIDVLILVLLLTANSYHNVLISRVKEEELPE